MNRRLLKSSNYIGDLNIGDVYHHGAIQITPLRNNEYINRYHENFIIYSNHALSSHLGYNDPELNVKKNRYGVKNSSLVSRGLVFNVGFGLSVHDISFNVVANLGYRRLIFYLPVFEWDILSSKSEIIGKEFRKDGADKGSVQVFTTVTNQMGSNVFDYTREVLVKSDRGRTFSKSSSIKKYQDLKISELNLPGAYQNLPKSLLGSFGKTFEELEIGKKYMGTFEKQLSLIDFTWLQTVSMIDSETHHQFDSNMIGYGGAVKAISEGMISCHIPCALMLGMNIGSHTGPTFPNDLINFLYNRNQIEFNEKIRAYFVVTEKTDLPDRKDIGIITIKLTAEKYITEAGFSALKKLNYNGLNKIFSENGFEFLKVLELEYLIAVPTTLAFSTRE